MACCIIYSVNITNYVILGIKICLYSVIPSLLPFMLITNYMQAHNLCTTVFYHISPHFQQIIRLVGIWNLCLNNRFYKWLSSFKAKIIGDLYSADNISFKKAKLLITFCNIFEHFFSDKFTNLLTHTESIFNSIHATFIPLPSLAAIMSPCI